MKSLLILTSLLISTQIFAENISWDIKKLNFSFSSRTSYYSEDYAEDRTLEVLETLGARNIENVYAYSHSNLPYNASVSVRATFQAATYSTDEITTEDAVWEIVKIKGDNACEFNTRLIDTILKKFETRNLKRRASCFDSTGHYSYELEVLK